MRAMIAPVQLLENLSLRTNAKGSWLEISMLSLALLVLGVDANHPHHAAPMDHLALITNLFHRCPNFHVPLNPATKSTSILPSWGAACGAPTKPNGKTTGLKTRHYL